MVRPRRSVFSLFVALFGVLAGGTALAGEVIAEQASALLAQAAKSPQAKTELLEKGRDRAAFCAYCHGSDGGATRPDYPNLAGQSVDYLAAQLRQFGGSERHRRVMNELSTGMTDADKALLVAYYNSLPPKPPIPGDAKQLAVGKGLFTARCQSCHGVDAHGIEGRARLASQKPAYLERILLDFRDGSDRAGGSVMRGLVKPLSDDDVRALAAYLASLP
ncbi:c-type cytochrome [Plasticicumulans acidivorans]|uniref:Cytochrome c553 n=1 Tax=Plasticicumulans acidivorans TaxID=886464 RepID=A0A317MW46_9GAMM|nr:c-type cytochrome [Plasticicumulans acidivorans]PWV61851.1 cytochrome c553 [Plasticicumulans acidivorans]